MITVITDQNQIENLHEKFHNCLGNFLTEHIDCIVGYQGGSFQDTVSFSPNLEMM